MAVDFNNVLNKSASDVTKPKAKPPGTYLASIVGVPSQKTATVQGEERSILEFKLKLVSPREDVSQDLLSEHPDISQWPPQRYDLWLTDDLWSLKRFLTDVCGIEPGPEDDSKTFSQMLAEVPGKTLLAKGEQKPYTDKTTGQPELAFNITSVSAA